MAAMQWRASTAFPSALARSVLLAWLGVVLASIAAPWARAGSAMDWERACSAAGEVRWIPGPAADGDAATDRHGLDCALCLPALVPPPDAGLPLRRAAPPEPPAAARYDRPWPQAGWIAPPPRAPPLRIPS